MAYLWRPLDPEGAKYECIKCGTIVNRQSNYCPDCGKKMTTECTCFDCWHSEVIDFNCLDGSQRTMCYCDRVAGCPRLKNAGVRYPYDTCRYAKRRDKTAL